MRNRDIKNKTASRAVQHNAQHTGQQAGMAEVLQQYSHQKKTTQYNSVVQMDFAFNSPNGFSWEGDRLDFTSALKSSLKVITIPKDSEYTTDGEAQFITPFCTIHTKNDFRKQR